MEVVVGRAFIARAVEECITSDHDGSAFDPGRDVTKRLLSVILGESTLFPGLRKALSWIPSGDPTQLPYGLLTYFTP